MNPKGRFRSHMKPSRSACFFFVDIVGLSDTVLATEDQVPKIEKLTDSVKECTAFKKVFGESDKETGAHHLIMPTGDGMVLDFGDDLESALLLALELQSKLNEYNMEQKAPEKRVLVRIGVHHGPIIELADIRGNPNVWGDGIIIARRIMDLGDGGHILTDESTALQLMDLRKKYKQIIHRMGDYIIKHGKSLTLYSVFDGQVGNREIPQKYVEQFAEENNMRPSTESLLNVRADIEIKDADRLQNLYNSIFSTHTIDQSYLYWGIEAAQRWQEVCKSREYELHEISQKIVVENIEEMIETIKQDTNCDVFDFINLGVGGGQKDIIILTKLLEMAGGKRLRYVPLDESDSMLRAAVDYVWQLNITGSYRNWETLAILGDLTRLERYKSLIRNPRVMNPKIYALLGSVIGNFDEHLILSSIRNSMEDSDVFILGADLVAGRKVGELKLGYEIKPVRKLIIAPLKEHLTFYSDEERVSNFLSKLDDATINVEVQSNKGDVPRSKRLQVYLNVDGLRLNHAYSTKYDLGCLKEYLTKTMKFRILDSYTLPDKRTKKERYVKFILRKQ
jgi:class 3 adenylate cyclase